MVRRFSSFPWSILFLLVLAVETVHADPLKSVAKELAKAMAKYKKDGRVAILVFPYEDGGLSSGSSLVSEHLTSLMAGRKHISVIERARLAELLGEMRLEESGVTESSGAQKAAGILGVDAVVTGTLSDSLEGETEVNARLIRMETGEIIAAASTNIDRTWQDRPQPPAPPPGAEDDDDHYVMHESPLIFTPSGRRGPPPPPTEEVLAYNNASPGAGSAALYNTSGPTAGTSAITINNTVVMNRPEHPRRVQRPISAVRAQMLYALGATLDVQGNRRAAQRFYRQARQQSSRY
jgi:hypothetical protein